jgi:protein-tyrosine phosphatase
MMQNPWACEQGICGVASPVRTGERFVDLHCHCLPDLDDGPASLCESLMLCRALANDDIGTVVATPHQLGCFETCTDARRIRHLVQRLNGELLDRGIDLRVLPGAEVRLDERLDALLAGGEILTLADRGRHLLLELPDDVFIDIEPLVTQLRARGVDIVIAHPERSAPLLGRPEALRRWLDRGVALQVTAASLTGGFGPESASAAWTLMAQGLVGIVATDAHDRGAGGPRMTEAFEMISDHFSPELACLLCIENPTRVLRGESLMPVLWEERQGVG